MSYLLSVNEIFHRFAVKVSKLVGSPWIFVCALLLIIVWILTGPIFQFSDTWQLVINTGTTIITFLMVFVIQNTQNREAYATQLKLDELIRAISNARNSLVNLEELSDEELEKLQEEFRILQGKNRTKNNPSHLRRSERLEDPPEMRKLKRER